MTCPHLRTSRNVSFAVHRSTAGVFRAKVFGARFPTASWGGSEDRIAASANSMRLDADVGLPALQDQQRDNDTLCLPSADDATMSPPTGAPGTVRPRLAIYSSADSKVEALSAGRIPSPTNSVGSPVELCRCPGREVRRSARSVFRVSSVTTQQSIVAEHRHRSRPLGG